MNKRFTLFFALCLLSSKALFAQMGDCPYPIIFLHGLTGNETSFQTMYTDPSFVSIWGGLSDKYEAVANATSSSHVFGTDGIAGTADDDVLVQFVNESNTLNPGCLYAINLENFWNQSASNPILEPDNDWGFWDDEADSNESAIKKQGYALKKCIEKVLAANPSKAKVVLVGHSMGGLMAREYLQRKEGTSPKWWITPSDAEGHKVARLLTVGTPHRGSNSFGNSSVKEENEAETRDGLIDLYSESIRDLRYSYACGFLNLSNCPGIYLYGGNETDLGNWYWNNDVDTDGDGTSTNVVGINQAGSPAWSGTRDNTAMPLPLNVRYTYYVSNLFNVGCDAAYPGVGCGGDGVVDDERQWIYTGGNGKTNSSLNGSSIPAPSDGVNYRLTDRVTSTNRINHLSQTNDLDFTIRGIDEADFPKFAYPVAANTWISGVSSIRADRVPTASELTNAGNKNIDCDWYKVTLAADAPTPTVFFQTNPLCNARVDFYTIAPSVYSNANSTKFATANKGNTTLLSVPAGSVIKAGLTVYIRITHYMSTATTPMTAWKTPYRFKFSTTGSSALTAANEEATTLTVENAYPNPAVDYFNVKIHTTSSEPLTWTMTTPMGKSVLLGEAAVAAGENELRINVQPLDAGIYFFTMEQNGTVKTVKCQKK